MDFYRYTPEYIRAVAEANGIDLTGVTLSDWTVGPSPMTDEQILDGLRMLAAIPEDGGSVGGGNALPGRQRLNYVRTAG